ncbi:MAG TPA: glycosyltransferase family 2 protein [Nitrospiria bacterium]|jgi:GT2 family glycosyltransferase
MVKVKTPIRTTVVIVNWNGGSYLRNCIQSIHSQTVFPLEIIVVDNHSTDESLKVLGKEKNLVTICNEENRGFSVACNQGIRLGKGTHFLILNSDTELERNYVEKMEEVLAWDERIGMVTGRILRFDRFFIDSCGQILGRNRRAIELGYGQRNQDQFQKPGEVFSICGAVAFYRKEMLEDIGIPGEYFDEDFFAFYEDIDLGWRARNRGWKGFYTPHALAYHCRGGTNSPKSKHSWFFSRFEFTRRPRSIQVDIVLNRYLTIIKNDRMGNFLRDLPFILFYEILLWGYIFIFRPVLVLDILKKMHLVKRAFMKRKMIQNKNHPFVNFEHKTVS